MKVQACRVTVNKQGKKMFGLAFLDSFDIPGVHFIVTEEGNKLEYKNVYNFELISTPMSYIHIGYRG